MVLTHLFYFMGYFSQARQHRTAIEINILYTVACYYSFEICLLLRAYNEAHPDL